MKKQEKSIKQMIVEFNMWGVENILEALTKLGYSPNLLFDDNGLWAVVTDGTQPVVTGKQKLQGNMTFFCEKKDWAPTIRKALLKYLKSLVE